MKAIQTLTQRKEISIKSASKNKLIKTASIHLHPANKES